MTRGAKFIMWTFFFILSLTLFSAYSFTSSAEYQAYQAYETSQDTHTMLPQPDDFLLTQQAGL